MALVCSPEGGTLSRCPRLTCCWGCTAAACMLSELTKTGACFRKSVYKQLLCSALVCAVGWAVGDQPLRWRSCGCVEGHSQLIVAKAAHRSTVSWASRCQNASILSDARRIAGAMAEACCVMLPGAVVAVAGLAMAWRDVFDCGWNGGGT